MTKAERRVTGAHLRAIRLEMKFTLRGFARHAHMDAAHLSNIESGVKVPTIDTIIKIARALAVTPGWLFARVYDTRNGGKGGKR